MQGAYAGLLHGRTITDIEWNVHPFCRSSLHPFRKARQPPETPAPQCRADPVISFVQCRADPVISLVRTLARVSEKAWEGIRATSRRAGIELPPDTGFPIGTTMDNRR